jgi:chloramphenicol-sensitive protein RarD
LTRSNDQTIGLLTATGAYVFWAGLAIYFKALGDTPPMQIMMHRIVWSFVILVPILLIASMRGEFAALLRDRRRMLIGVGTALLLAINWLIFIGAIASAHALEAGLGYFICPLLTVLLGAMALREPLRSLQWAGVAVVSIGVLYLTIMSGRFPWISLSLAVTFALYGFGKKKLLLSAASGLLLDTMVMLPPILIYWAWNISAGTDDFAAADWGRRLFFMAAGPLTSFPLILFAMGANRLKLATLGILQYLNPCLQVVIAIFVFGEPFTQAHAVSFAAIWLGLLLYFMPEPAILRRRPKSRPAGSGNPDH